ncbi:MAG TPA: thermonuclease family protein [Acidimicrobiales bacterium]
MPQFPPAGARARTFVLALAALAAGAVALAAVRASSPPPGDDPAGGGGGAGGGGQATVVRVVDGDTLVVEVGGRHEPVRLIGIDTPETVHPDRPAECFGAEASARLAALLPPGATVRLTRDVEPRDVYDRLLAYVERTPDGLLVNVAQVAGGYAEASHHPPNTVHRDGLDEAERAARAAGLGLWSACGGTGVPLPPSDRPG